MEETINLIKRRYIHERAIYTWCGMALVAVNPYQEQDIYGEQVVETYHSASHSVYLQLDPHIYAVTEDAYSKLELNFKNQSIIVSGESGAGKTVSAKHSMRYLASIAGSSRAKLRIENRVLASNPIMEAIGNASTVRNDNSSRFGKYIQIYFDRHSRRMLGANMRTYLLEKSRVSSQQAGERNYHIFYQLLNYAHQNPQKTAHLQLVDPDDSNRLRKFNFLAGAGPQEARDDLRRFNEALRTPNVDEQRVDVIYRIVAAILHGGNIEFVARQMEEPEASDAPCTIAEEDFHFRACCELIGLEPAETRKRLTIKLLRGGARDIIEQPQSRQKAEYARDAMLKYIYECLFAWLVALINLSLCSKEAGDELRQSAAAAVPKSPSAKKSILEHLQQQQQQQQEPQFIGVLDIYGFENFAVNSFEQFCINYANEVLQQQYNQHVFKIEQEEYIREGIDWTFIEYTDNQPVIDVIESRPIGILNLLDEECKMPRGSDKSWCAKLYEQLLPAKEQATHRAPFKRPKLNYQHSFTMCHYAEDVDYNVAGFLEKNRDSIGEEQCEMLRKSPVLSYIFEDPLLAPDTRPKARTTRSATVGWQFRGSLAALIKTLNATEPHYIRCIKPNDDKRAFEFNEQRAIQQLKACGVYETIRISNNGFPSRWQYKDFAKRYSVIIYATDHYEELMRANSVRPICEAICRAVYEPGSRFASLRTQEEQRYVDGLFARHGNKSGAIYQLGRTKIFFRAGQLGYLERIRAQKLRDYTITIQRHVRGWLARRSFRVKRALYYEELRREASLISLQNQVSSLQTELDQVREEKEEQVSENVSRLGSMYQLVIDIMYTSIQPLIISAVLEYEALDPPAEPFGSLESTGSRSNSPGAAAAAAEHQSMETLMKELDRFYDLTRKNCVPEDIAIQAFKQIFYLICAYSLNQLLIRRDLCQFRKAMQINFNLSCLVQWCRERFPVRWRDIVAQLDPITQATKLLQTRKSSEDIATIEEVCNKLRPSQIIKILNMYTSSYEEQITTDFIHELEEYLNVARASKHQMAAHSSADADVSSSSSSADGAPRLISNGEEGHHAKSTERSPEDPDSGFDMNNNGSYNNNDLLMDTRHYFAFVDLEGASCDGSKRASREVLTGGELAKD